MIPIMQVHSRFIVAGIFSAALLAGCSMGRSLPGALVDRLNGQGPLAVSPDNPYVATNLLLHKESERSSELRGFLQLRGQPRALSVQKDFLSAARLELFYASERGWEIYTLEPLADTWIVKGPEAVSPELTSKLRSQVPEAGRDTASSPAPSASGAFSSPLPKRSQDTPPKPQVSEAKRTDRELVESIQSASAQGAAETTPKGDVVHYVTYSGETLALIARWYTYDHLNASRLARINQIPDPNVLEIGDQIIVPSYMVKNKVRLSEESIRSLKLGHQ